MVAATVLSFDGGLARLDVAGQVAEVAASDPPPRRVLLCLRPEDVVLTPGEVDVPSSARNRLRGTVRRVTPTGTVVRVEVDCGFPIVATITRRSLEELSLGAGSKLMASFKATAAHLIPHGGGSGS